MKLAEQQLKINRSNAKRRKEAREQAHKDRPIWRFNKFTKGQRNRLLDWGAIQNSYDEDEKARMIARANLI